MQSYILPFTGKIKHKEYHGSATGTFCYVCNSNADDSRLLHIHSQFVTNHNSFRGLQIYS